MPSRDRPFLSSAAVIGLLALGLAGCKSPTLSSGSLLGTTGSIGQSQPQTQDEWRREADAAGQRYRANPKDADAALRYAEALRHTGQRAQAAAVLQQASLGNPHHKRLLGAYGRALADTGQFAQALDFLGRAHSPDQPDWRVLSAQGAVLDQMGRHDEARGHYASALKIVPDEPTVLSNLGLSYALSKNLRQAEETLRKASDRAKGDRRVRQNLALVIGLQGRFQEAETMVRADLPAAEAADNIAYLRQMLAEHRSREKPQKQRTRTQPPREAHARNMAE